MSPLSVWGCAKRLLLSLWRYWKCCCHCHIWTHGPGVSVPSGNTSVSGQELDGKWDTYTQKIYIQMKKEKSHACSSWNCHKESVQASASYNHMQELDGARRRHQELNSYGNVASFSLILLQIEVGRLELTAFVNVSWWSQATKSVVGPNLTSICAGSSMWSCAVVWHWVRSHNATEESVLGNSEVWIHVVATRHE